MQITIFEGPWCETTGAIQQACFSGNTPNFTKLSDTAYIPAEIHPLLDSFLVYENFRYLGLQHFHLSAEMLAAKATTIKDKLRYEKFLRVKRALERVLLSKQTVILLSTYDGNSSHVVQKLSKIASTSFLPVIKYDNSDYCLDVTDKADKIRPPVNQGPGIGNFVEGNTLIIGEQPAEQKGRKDYPFASDMGCSYWLNSGLTSHNVDERKLYWINAINAAGKTEDPGFLDKLKPSKIITLGKIADKWCVDNKLEHEAIAHPQYWKRFRSKEEYPLFELL